MADESPTTNFSQLAARLEQDRVVERIFERDFTLWSDSPEEISDRLGWLDCPADMREAVNVLTEIAEGVRKEEIDDVVLLGMGGSSLGAEVLQQICGKRSGYPEVQIIDTTDPLTIAERQKRLDPAKTLFIVATKSGGTVETFSLFKYFYRWLVAELGAADAARSFVAITDPGSKLVEIAKELGFRAAFLNDPDIGGRYSALSYFGLVPAALAGIDLNMLLDSAEAERRGSTAELGAFLGGAASAGRNKLTVIADSRLRPFGAWLEQLVAESSGKHGRGILPVTGERWLQPDEYGPDRCFAVLAEAAGSPAAKHGELLAGAGHPVIALEFDGPRDLGAQFFKWELATAVACHVIGVNPFDQPNVEAAKNIAREAMASYADSGELPPDEFALSFDGLHFAGARLEGDSPREIMGNLVEPAEPGGYICIQAFLPAVSAVETALAELADSLRSVSGLPVVHGLGPRYLHSTGQLHKGGPAGGLYLQLTSADKLDLDIPDTPAADDSSASFGVLKRAQARGDYHALVQAGRTIVACHMDEHLVGLARLIALVKNLD